MYSFNNDYSEGCHPNILKRLMETNLEQCDGYGLDIHSENAARLIRTHIENEHADVHFIAGGTQTNLIALSSFLRPHEAIVSASTAHINVHETGAIEYTGHKVLTAQTINGKLTPQDIQPILENHPDEHMVKPRLVYISNSTELGTVYTKEELANLSRYCQRNELILFLDGARLGQALCASTNDLTMAEIAELTDAFYIGGTKNGALIGEALIITNDSLKNDFRYLIKQKGAMLAKGKLLGIQFEELFTDNLYYELAKHADNMADKLRSGLSQNGIKFASDSPSNQLFPILSDGLISKLQEKYKFSVQFRDRPGYSCVRLVTSWASKESEVNAFLEDFESLFSEKR